MNRKVLRNKAYLMAHSFNRTKMFHSKKGWLVSTALILAMLGVGATSHAQVHADPTVNADNNAVHETKPQAINSKAQVVKSNLTSPKSAVSASASSIASAFSAKSSAPASPASSSANIPSAKPSPVSSSVNAISNVHKGLMLDADNNDNTLSIGHTPEDRVRQAKAWNFTQHGINNDDYDNYKIPTSNKTNLKTTKPLKMLSSVQQSDQNFPSENNWIYSNGKYLSDSDVHDWQNGKRDYYGLSYKYSPSKQAIEFLRGTVPSDANDNLYFGGYTMDTTLPTTPSSLKFDKSVIVPTHNITAPQVNDENLKSIAIDYNMKNVPRTCTINESPKLQSVVFPSDGNANNFSDSDASELFFQDTSLNCITVSSPNVMQELAQDYDNNKISFLNPSQYEGDIPSWFANAYQKSPDGDYTSSTPVNLLDGGSHVGTFLASPIAKPTIKTDTINYSDNGKNVGSEQVTGLSNQNLTIGSNPTNLPSDYKVINPSQQFNYDGGTHNVPVELNDVTDNIVFQDQNKNVFQGHVTGLLGSTVSLRDVFNQNQQNNSALKGYHLGNDANSKLKLTEGGLTILPVYKNVGMMLGVSAPDTYSASATIPIYGNPITYTGTVTLKYNANGHTVKSIQEPYTVNSNVGSDVTLFKPSDYLNKNISDFDTHNYKQSDNSAYNSFQVQPTASTSPNGTTVTKNYTLNFTAQPVTDHINYVLDTNSTPQNYTGSKGTLGHTTATGTYDTNVAQSALNNVPNNYHIVNMNNLQYDGGQNDTVYVAPNQETVNVDYHDTDKGGVILDNNAQSDTKYFNTEYGVNNSDVTKTIAIPNGYHYVSGNKNYTANGNQSQVVNIDIAGNTQRGTVDITANKYDNGNSTGTSDATQSVSGPTGTNYSIDPTSYSPTGYNPEKGEIARTGTFESNGINNSNMSFNYDATAGQPITVNYVNQNGVQVDNGSITGNTDDTGNITDAVKAPAGYKVNKGDPTTYHIHASKQNPITMNVTGEPASTVDTKSHGNFVITIKREVNGKPFGQPYTTTVDLSKVLVGNSDTIDPSNYEPHGYSPAAASQPITVSVKPTGLSSEGATFTYTANAGGTITVDYVNQHGVQVGSGIINGTVDVSGDATKSVTVPSNYTVNNGANTGYTFTTIDQTLKIGVTGKNASAKVNFINQDGNLITTRSISSEVGNTVPIDGFPKGYEVPKSAQNYTFNNAGNDNPDDNITLHGLQDKSNVTVTVKEVVNGKTTKTYTQTVPETSLSVGDSYTIKPTDTMPNGYQPTSSDKAVNGVINSDQMPSVGTASFNYDVDSSQIEPIKVTYQNQKGVKIGTNGYQLPSNDSDTTELSGAQLATLGAVGDNVNIMPLLTAPTGYHFKSNYTYNINLAKHTLGQVPMLLFTLSEPTPKKPAKPVTPTQKYSTIEVEYLNNENKSIVKSDLPMTKPVGTPFDINDYTNNIPSGYTYAGVTGSVSKFDGTNHIINILIDPVATPSAKPTNNSGSATSGSVKPSSGNSANTSASAPSANNSGSAQSSATPSSVQPQFIVTPSNSASSSVAPSASASNSSSASSSTSANTSLASDNNVTPASNSNVAPSSSDTTPTLKPNTQPSVQPESDNSIQPSSPNNVVTPSSATPTGNNVVGTEPTEAQSPIFSNVPSDNEALANNTVATPDNNTDTGKLPQTNEATNYAGITAMVALMLSVGLAGVDLKRKHE